MFAYLIKNCALFSFIFRNPIIWSYAYCNTDSEEFRLHKFLEEQVLEFPVIPSLSEDELRERQRADSMN